MLCIYISRAEKGNHGKQHYDVTQLINVLKMTNVKSEVF